MTDHFNDYLDGKLSTTSGQVPKHFDSPAPDADLRPDGQHSDYWVLSETERAKGFVRPVRVSYVHDTCGVETRMSLAIAETYARDPKFYGATFCVGCGAHFPVGEHGQFRWTGTAERVGT